MEKIDIINVYRQTGSIRATSASSGIGHQAVRRVLIEAGEFASPRAEQIMELYEQGVSPDEICAKLSLTRSCVFSYLPYTRGTYLFGPRSINALRIEECRRKKAEQSKSKPAP